MKTLPTNAVFTIAERAPRVQDALLAAVPWLAAELEQLGKQLPVPPASKPFVEGQMMRLPQSNRTVYFAPRRLDQPASSDRGVFVMKGQEPLCDDFERTLTHLASVQVGRTLEEFALEEQKAPCSVFVAEALTEATRAVEVQAKHLEVYGGLARLPVPLLVHRHDDEVLALSAARFQRVLSSHAYAAIEPFVGRGLGTYVYYYPSLPLRALQVGRSLPEHVPTRLAMLRAVLDPEALLQRWTQLFVRLVYLGYLPASRGVLLTGNCCQAQNAVVDGGFVDVDSITPIGDLHGAAFWDALQLSVMSLAWTAYELLVRSPPWRGPRPFVRGEPMWETAVIRHVTTLLRHALDSEARPGLELDARVRQYFTADLSFSSMLEIVSSYASLAPAEYEGSVGRFMPLLPIFTTHVDTPR